MSPLERGLAEIRGKLKEKYGSDHDNTLSYIDPVTSETVVMTLHMIKEWSRAIVSIMIYSPRFYACYTPYAHPYDTSSMTKRPAMTNLPTLLLLTVSTGNLASNVLASRFLIHTSATGSSSSGDHMATQALGAISQVFGFLDTVTKGKGGFNFPQATPPRSTANITQPPNNAIDSPIANTPSKLARFLKYAEGKGTIGASSYLHELRMEGYGPDILHLVTQEQITALGISKGDAIRLQTLAPKWWEMEKARPHPQAPATSSNNDHEEPKSIRFEKHWFDKDGEKTGTHSIWGTGITEGVAVPGVDFKWFFYSEDFRQMVPLPPNYFPVFEADGIDVGMEEM